MELEKLKSNGYTWTYDTKVMDLLGNLPPLKEWHTDEYGLQFPKDIDLSQAQDYIFETYVKNNFIPIRYGYKNLWNNTDKPSMSWHNDLIEGSNIFFMYYLNDVNTGGEICFRVNSNDTGYLKPKKHLLVLGSQESNVEHKVNPTTEKRIVCNFGFEVQWI